MVLIYRDRKRQGIVALRTNPERDSHFSIITKSVGYGSQSEHVKIPRTNPERDSHFSIITKSVGYGS